MGYTMPMSFASLRWCHHDTTRLEVGKSIGITSKTIPRLGRCINHRSASSEPDWMFQAIKLGYISHRYGRVHTRRIDFNHAYQQATSSSIYPSYRSSRTYLSVPHQTTGISMAKGVNERQHQRRVERRVRRT